MTPQDLKAVLLDAAGTLVHIEPPAPRLQALLAERSGVELELHEASAAIHAEIVYYRGHMHEGSNQEGLTDLRHRCAEVLRQALPTSAALDEISTVELAEILIGSLEFGAYPDVVPSLQQLRDAGLRLVVASNWDCSLPSVLERIGVSQLVDGVACSAVVGAAKPDPELLRAALRIAGVQASAAVHVGNSVMEDVGAALAAGVRPVFLNRDEGSMERGEEPPAVAVIASLSELPTLLGL